MKPFTLPFTLTVTLKALVFGVYAVPYFYVDGGGILTALFSIGQAVCAVIIGMFWLASPGHSPKRQGHGTGLMVSGMLIPVAGVYLALLELRTID